MDLKWNHLSLVLIVLVALLPPLSHAYSGGSGAPQEPYQIATAADLIALGNEPNDYGKCFILTADIDLDPNLPGGKVFDRAVIAPDTDDTWSIFKGPPFTGVFDGRGHKISHLSIAGGDYLGLFGQLYPPAEVMNLGVVDVNIIGSGITIGGLVGMNGIDVVLTGCYSTGAVRGIKSCVGGLVGINGFGKVIQCNSACTVQGHVTVGGLVGSNIGEITRCYSTGAVSATQHVGGLVGYNAGEPDEPWGRVSQCYSTGAVSGNSYVGGLVGDNKGDVAQCYSIGRVQGEQFVGGLVEEQISDWGTERGSFWDTQTSGQTTSRGGTSLTTAEMQMAQTFIEAGRDFNDVWVIWNGYDYPHLQWESGPGLVFVDIPSGTFKMGDHDGIGESSERPVHTVTLTGFQMSKYEVTNAQYTAYLNAAMAAGQIQVVKGVVYTISDSSRSQPYFDTVTINSYSQIEYNQGQFTVRSRDGKSMADHSVVQVRWYGAKAFCDYYGYRLPTEAEWEYAARGGYHDPYYRYPWGSNTIDCTKANYYNGSNCCNPLNLTSYPYTSPVGYYGAQGAYGLCDMSGNVWEWCQDWYDEDYYSVSPAKNPAGPATGTFRVVRGGCWYFFDYYCRVADRVRMIPEARGDLVGFRVCR
jgi:formylglycine-generating enzyme required for sulfatase activity